MRDRARSGDARAAGHRSVPHTADLRIEAWGRTREECVAQAIRGLVDSFADVSGAGCLRATHRHLPGGADADLVAAAVEEVIYALDTENELPAVVEAERADDGGIDLTLWVVDADTVEITGAAPKAASLSGLHCRREASGFWSCAVTVDV